MKISNNDLKYIISRAPAVYSLLEKYNNLLDQYGFGISARDTDHTYESFRWDIYSLNGNASNSTIHEFYNLIQKDLEEHCCICGSNHMVRIKNYNSKEDSLLFNRFCGLCYAKQIGGYKKILHYAELNEWCRTQNKEADLPNIKVRLINKSNVIFYEKIANIYFDKELYVSNLFSSHEPVRYAGSYLGLRDKNGERIFEGDVVYCIGENCTSFWGMAFEGEVIDYLGHDNRIDNIWLHHDYLSFPSPLKAALEFEVIGNVLEGNENKIENPELSLYYDCEYFSNLVQHRFLKMNI